MSTKHGGGMASEAPSGVFDWRRAMNESESDDPCFEVEEAEAERFGVELVVTGQVVC